MTIKPLDRAFETTQSTGTGQITLQGAQQGFQSFAAAGNGAKVFYQINDGDSAGVVQNWEIGIGTVNVGTPNTLTRASVLKSSNNNAAVNFGAGTKNVIGSIAASGLTTRDEGLFFTEGYGIGGGSANAQTVTLPYTPIGYSDGAPIYFFASVANTGAMTINVNGLGAKAAKLKGADIPAGAITAGMLVHAVYRASSNAFELLMPFTTPELAPAGQCRLIKSGANLVLLPYNGNKLTIDGVQRSIPAGVVLAPTGLTAATTYFIYAYMAGGGIVALEASTTGHSTDTTTGVEIKTGDSTRTLVGMARTIAGPAWQDTEQQRFVISWFNRRAINTSGAFTAARTTVSTTPVELNAEIRNEFLCWSDDTVQMSITGGMYNSGGFFSIAAIGFNGTNPENDVSYMFGQTVGSSSVTVQKQGLNEGYNYATHLGRTGNASGTATFGNPTINLFNRLSGRIQG